MSDKQNVEIHGQRFDLYISAEKIQASVKRVAEEINRSELPENTLFLCVLRGAYIFIADLMRELEGDFPVEFIRLRSYEGTESGKLHIGEGAFNPEMYDIIVIVEDIIDTGRTLSTYKDHLISQGANKIKIATLLRKPAATTENIEADYVGFDIPNDFVVGYGMDYDGLGRGLPAIYQWCE